MTIKVKRVYLSPSPDDGVRVLVDRLWPRGLRKDAAAIDFWPRELAPSTELRHWFGHDPARWEEFRQRYHAELEGQPQALAELRERARQGTLTLVYAARDEAHNNAVALAEYLDEAAGRRTAA